MASFLLIRHAEPLVKGVLLGRMDPPLSPEGLAQAKRALADLEVEIVWSSPLLRARQTAQCMGKQVAVLPELTEIDQGLWTGKSWSEIEARWRDLARRKADDWLGESAPEGETWQQVLERARAVWQAVRKGPSPAAIVGHQGINSALLYAIRGGDPLNFEQAYGEAIRADVD